MRAQVVVVAVLLIGGGFACESKKNASALPVAPAAGAPAGTAGTSAGSTSTPTAGTGTQPTAAHGDVPCDAAAVLKAHCVRCHGNTLREGAPLTLVDAASFMKDLGGQSAGLAALARIRNDTRPMPPVPSPRLTAAEVAPLEAWIHAGALPSPTGCSVDDSPPAAGSGGTGGVVVMTAGTGGAAGSGAPADGGVSEPADPTGDWAMFGGDLANSRNNPGEKTLAVANVGKLRELWSFMGPSTTSAPAVVDGVIYLPGWDAKVYALRLEDGTPVWTTTLPDLIDSSPSVTASQVFISDDNGSVHALDRATGKVQWSQAVDPHVETHLWSSPAYIPEASLVVVGVASGEEAVRTAPTFRGSVVGLDAATGTQRWRFETAPAATGSGPGVAVWASPTVDTKRKLVYIGTGNNYAAPASEYADSMLAINYETGKLAWHHQFTASDVFTVYSMGGGPDHDIGSTANLFTVDGRDSVGIGVKSGIYYALDRDTGAVQWQTMLTTGSPLGGVISPSAYANGMAFVASNEQAGLMTVTFGVNVKDGTIVWRHEAMNLTYGGVAHANGVVYLGTTAGGIYALDGANGTALWTDQTPNNQPIAGSPVVAQGKLVVPWGYRWTLREGVDGGGGITVYGL